MGDPSKMGLWCPCQPTSKIHLTEEMVGCGETIPAATCPPGLVYPVEEDRVNEKPKGRPVPREGKKQHLLRQPREGGIGAKHWGAQGCTPSFWERPLAPLDCQQSTPKASYQGNAAKEDLRNPGRATGVPLGHCGQISPRLRAWPPHIALPGVTLPPAAGPFTLVSSTLLKSHIVEKE